MTINLSEVGKTNETYSDGDSKIIQRALFSVEKRLCDLQNHATENTRGQIWALINEIHRYKVALAPHKKLSEDLLRYIFILCAGNAPVRFPAQRETNKKDSHPRLPPIRLILSQVCSSWRQIALYSAELWNNVSFNAYPITPMLLTTLENG